MLECKPSLPQQVPLSMTSKSILLYSEPSLPACSQIFDSICDLPSTSSLPTFPPEYDYDYLIESRSLLIEYESNTSLNVASDEHSLTFDLALFTQKTSFTAPPKHTASIIDQLPFNLQQFLFQQRINFNSQMPLRAFALQEELAVHPDQNFVHKLIHNIRCGCNIGYAGP